MPQFTPSQQNVINYKGKNILVSASAGTGKTTVMIERIAKLIADGADISQFVVVTFTNLAAAEMKKRLGDKLAEKRNDRCIVEQLEKLDNADICTIHSFCGELLRNYFYVVDVDPSFAILDSVTVASLRQNALDEVFRDYFKADDPLFKKVYQIFATKRREENFKNTVTELYAFSRCLENFAEWYDGKRQAFLQYSEDNPIVLTLKNDIAGNVKYFADTMRELAAKNRDCSLEVFAKICEENAKHLAEIDLSTLESAMFGLALLKQESLPRRSKKDLYSVDKSVEEQSRQNFEDLKKEIASLAEKYENLCRGQKVADLWQETAHSVQYADKLVEIVQRFDEKFFALKKQRGGVDFNDLEHLALKILRDEEALQSVKERYKFVFVDEYQDTNPVQEAIVSKIAREANLFMVGDIKQSIYGFRGCEPTIFLEKYQSYKSTDASQVEELNDNFRSNSEILEFVNQIFDRVMTYDFGKVDYRGTARLAGTTAPCLKAPSVEINLVVAKEKEENPITEMYDITAENRTDGSIPQGEVIAQKIAEYVGMAYKDKEGNSRRIGYGDIVVLMRGLRDKAVGVYNALVSHNIPVTANFKTQGYANKEVRDIINLLRALDNPYNDIYTVGACLAPFGGFTESQLAQIKIATQNERVPFYTRLQMYAGSAQNDTLSVKIDILLQLFDTLRFYSHGATVDEVVLKVFEKTQYHLYVQGLPNGTLRLRKLYAFVDSLKGAAYAQSLDKFLSYLDETEESPSEEGAGSAGAVRLMTMHASKGLEFPVVIIAGVESSFSVDHPSVERNTQLGLAVRHYDFEKMRVANTLGTTACGMFNKTKLQEEEMRLLYVAMTRAKFALNIVGTVSEKQLTALPKQATAANSHMDWLMSALKQKYGSLTAPECSFVKLVRELRPESRLSSENLLCDQYTDKNAVLEQLRYRYPYADQTDMPTKIVSSALDKEYIDSDSERADFVLVENGDRNAVGTAYHKVYQFVDCDADKEGIRQTLEGLVREGKIDPAHAAQVDVDLVFDTLNNAELRKLMSQGRVYHEMPFMLTAPYDSIAVDKRFSDDVMLQGVIDLLILGENSAVVVDFKYSTHAEERLKKSYRAQLASYRLAVQKICGITDVKSYILSIEENKLIPMD